MKQTLLKARIGENFDQWLDLELKPRDSIYFMGICGTAMASLAVYLQKEGFKVSGSDQSVYPPMSTALKQAGIFVFNYNPDNIQTSIKLAIVGNVISKTHSEIQAIKKLKIPVLSLPEFLEQTFLSQTKNLVIVGTHGKSTSTALMSHVAEALGCKPGFFVGAIPKNFSFSFRGGKNQISVNEHSKDFVKEGLKEIFIKQIKKFLSFIKSIKNNLEKYKNQIQKKSKKENLPKTEDGKRVSVDSLDNYFVIEGDEYDTSFFAKKPKFFYYKPFSVLLTGIEFDHGDIYNSLEEIRDLFVQLVKKIPKEGHLIVCADNSQAMQVIQHSKAPVVTFGKNKADYTIKNLSVKDDGQSFDIVYKKETQSCFIPLLGEYNALNALAVFALSHQLKWPVEKVLSAFKTFKGLKRRLEFLGEWQETKVYEDFAHHPTAVKACLSALKSAYPDKKLLVCFEPRSFTSRLNIFQKDYVSAFAKADKVFIAKAYDTSKIPEEKQFSPEKLVQDLKEQGQSAGCYDIQSMEDQLKQELHKDHIIVFMSSGAFGGLLQKIRKQLQS